MTYNLAYGGATVDGDLVAPYEPTVLSVKQQVQDEFLPTYGSHPASAPWTSGETLVAVWIGINDIGNSYWSQNSTLNPTIFAELSDLVESVYQTGAKNFLFLNVPPVERSPLTQSQGDNTEQGVKLEKADIADWNARVEDMAKNLTTAHADATTFVFDTYALFNQVLDDPSSTPETAIYQNTTDYCDAYQKYAIPTSPSQPLPFPSTSRHLENELHADKWSSGTSDPDSYDASCGIPVNEYFWLNSLHPTYPVHNATAREIAELLS